MTATRNDQKSLKSDLAEQGPSTHDSTLLRLAQRDLMPADAGFILPVEDRLGRELGPVVRDDLLGLSGKPDQRIQFARHAQARYGCVRDQGQILAIGVVDLKWSGFSGQFGG